MLLLLPLRILIPRITIAFGLFLIVVGLWGFFASDMVSLTAMIPAAFGAVFAVLGAISAANHKTRPLMMRIASVLALVSVVATAKGLPDAFAALGGGEVAGKSGPLAAYAKATMCVSSAIYLVANLYAFSSAKKKLAADEKAGR